MPIAFDKNSSWPQYLNDYNARLITVITLYILFYVLSAHVVAAADDDDE